VAVQHAGPYGSVDPKRSFDKVPVTFDWHDYLLNARPLGVLVAVDFCIRPPRKQATGYQLRCVKSGTTSGSSSFKWATVLNQTIQDGTATWKAELLTNESLRSTIQTATQVSEPSGLTLSAASPADLVYTVYADEGVSGTSYEIRHQITLANNREEKEGVAVLLVQD
jgi:hypothetical protein